MSKVEVIETSSAVPTTVLCEELGEAKSSGARQSENTIGIYPYPISTPEELWNIVHGLREADKVKSRRISLPVLIRTPLSGKEWDKLREKSDELNQLLRFAKVYLNPQRKKEYLIELVEMAESSAHTSVGHFFCTHWDRFQMSATTNFITANPDSPPPPEVMCTYKAVGMGVPRIPDAAFVILSDTRFKVNNLTNVVLEVGYSQSSTDLARDAAYWLGQGMSAVITVKLKRKDDVSPAPADRIPGSPKYVPRFNMTLRFYTQEVDDPEPIQFGNAGKNALNGPNQVFFDLPLVHIFDRLDEDDDVRVATSKRLALELAPSRIAPRPRHWHIDLYHLQQFVLQRALVDGHDGDSKKPMTFYS